MIPTFKTIHQTSKKITALDSIPPCTEIPGARLAVIPAAGHLSNLEQPEVFNDLVRNFVEELRAAGD